MSHFLAKSTILCDMRNTMTLVLLGFFFSTAHAALADADPMVGKHVPPFSAQLMDVSGETPTTAVFDSTTANRITTYMVVGVNCPTTRAYSERVSQLQKLYAPKEVDFVFIYSNREDTLDGKIAFHRERQLGGKLIDDQGGEIAKKFGAKHTSEIFVANKEGSIVYHGAVDDSRNPTGVKQHYLQMALDETLAGSPVTVSSSAVQA